MRVSYPCVQALSCVFHLELMCRVSKPQQCSGVYLCSFANLDLGHQMHVHPSEDSRRCIVPGFLNLCLVEIVLSADPARAVHVHSPMHGVHTWPKVLVWTPETLRASQSEKDTSVPCCLYLSEDSNALAYISGGGRAGRAGGAGGGAGGRACACARARACFGSAGIDQNS